MNLNNLSKKTFLIVEVVLGIAFIISILFLPFAISFLILFLEVNLYLFKEKKDNILYMLNSISFGIVLTSSYYFENIGLILMLSYIIISIFLTVKSDMWYYDDLKKQNV